MGDGKCYHGDGVACGSGELDFGARFVVAMDYGADISRFEARLGTHQ
jgi:hypothetical protein